MISTVPLPTSNGWFKRQPGHAQAWLTLATVRRVQGRYGDSDRACESVAAAGAYLYARACRAENDSLRGDFNGARAALVSLLGQRNLPAQTKNWLLTTLAESEARAGLAGPAETAYRSALAEQRDSYTAISFADFLIEQGRYTDARLALAGQTRTDAVLLRLAIAGVAANVPGAGADVRGVARAHGSGEPSARNTIDPRQGAGDVCSADRCKCAQGTRPGQGKCAPSAGATGHGGYWLRPHRRQTTLLQSASLPRWWVKWVWRDVRLNAQH